MSASNANGGPRKIAYLELLRFVLAFLTMAWHYYFWGPSEGAIDWPVLQLPGLRYFSFSVEIFFIISGFIITASALGRKPADFLLGRAVRLGPCLLVCASLTFFAGSLLGHAQPLSNYLASILVAPLAFWPGVDASYWSLRYELTFYALIFALACCVSIERNIARIALALTLYDVALAVLDAFGLRLHYYRILHYPGETYTTYFALGVALYVVLKTRRFNWTVAVALAADCGLGVLRCYQNENAISKLIGLAPISMWTALAIFAVLPVVFIAFVRDERRPWLARLYTTLGRTSYPLYLVHGNLGYWVIAWVHVRLHVHVDVRPLVMLAMVLLAASIALGLEPALAARYRRSLGHLAGASRALQLRAAGLRRRVEEPE